MADAIQIYGKSTWPYTNAAREALGARKDAKVDYFDVKNDPAAMERFLRLSGGGRRVPLIVEGSRITVGFGGSWGV